MAKGKQKTTFFCKECGFESPKWLGQCPGCKEWDSFVEEPVVKTAAGRFRHGDGTPGTVEIVRDRYQR